MVNVLLETCAAVESASSETLVFKDVTLRGATERLSVSSRVTAALTPVMVRGYVSTGTVEATVIVSVVEHVGVQLVGEKLVVTPEGAPVTENAALPGLPEVMVAVTFTVPDSPRMMLGVNVESESEKSGGGAATLKLTAKSDAFAFPALSSQRT
jgi:hypothetical protein